MAPRPERAPRRPDVSRHVGRMRLSAWLDGDKVSLSLQREVFFEEGQGEPSVQRQTMRLFEDDIAVLEYLIEEMKTVIFRFNKEVEQKAAFAIMAEEEKKKGEQK